MGFGICFALSLCFLCDNYFVPEVCGGELREPNLTFESPVEDGSYPPFLQCQWRIVAPNGQKISLQVRLSSLFAVPPPACFEEVKQIPSKCKNILEFLYYIDYSISLGKYFLFLIPFSAVHSWVAECL